MFNWAFILSLASVLPGLSALALFSACGVSTVGSPTPTENRIGTEVALTVTAELTRIAGLASPTPPAPTASPSPIPASPTLENTATASPTPTLLPTATPTPRPCDLASFRADVTIADGTTLKPGVSFGKTWRLENVGTCTWTSEYDLVFLSGDRMKSPLSFPFPGTVRPGETMDLTIKLVAPVTPGTYQGFWRLRNANGVLFGVGEGGDGRIWVRINVREPSREKVFDFVARACEAEWESATGSLPCPGSPEDPNGSVVITYNPALENRNEDEPTLLVHPGSNPQGWIRGTYPLYQVREGDIFRAWIGCTAGAEDCQVAFSLDYRREGSERIFTIGSWKESFDGEVTKLSVELDDLMGEEVHFQLSVANIGQEPEQARAFWFVPHISRVTGFIP